MVELPSLLLGSVLLRPYVFVFLALYLAAAWAAWGWRRAAAFSVLAGGLAFAAEWTSTRIGLPFGLYHYTGETQGRELYLGNVPFFDPLSFTFLAYASLGLARLLLGRGADHLPGRLGVAAATGLVMMWLDLVIDPLAVRGDRWFLGRVFYYPEPGWYFGVPLTNFAGWAALGSLIAWVWLGVEPRLAGQASRRAGWRPGPAYRRLVLYYLVLGFNLALTGVVAEAGLFWSGLALHLPLAGLVVCSLSVSRRMQRMKDPRA